jgi:ELWxxDGT repeat protein
MLLKYSLGTSVLPLAASIFLALGSNQASADPIPAQPIGFLGKKEKSSDPADFFVISGPGRRGVPVVKLFFNARVKDLGGNGEVRKWYVQQIEPNDDPTVRYHLIDKKAPARPLGSFKLAPGAKVESFIPVDNLGTFQRAKYERMFFRVPGVGIFNTIGGGKPKKIRSEHPTDATKAIIGPAIRLSSFVFDNQDEELQSRLFFSGFDTRGGREPFISGGTSRSTKVLKNIYAEKNSGSDCGAFVIVGPQNESQDAFFTAKSPDDNDSVQIWQVLVESNGGDVTYDAVPFTTGVSALPGTPENLVGNESGMFFTAPPPGGGTPELWRLDANDSAADLRVLTSGGSDPQQLTFNSVEDAYDVLVMSVLDNGVRRYARWGNFSDTVTVIDGTSVGAFRNPKLITDAGNYFYFSAEYDEDGVDYLIKHAISDNSVGYVTATIGGSEVFPFNISEICTVASDASGGTVYFVADAIIGGTTVPKILFKIEANETGYEAEPVLSSKNKFVTGARNLSAVVSPGGAGIFRLYFSAPINSNENSDYLPEGSEDEGYEPWVTEDE